MSFLNSIKNNSKQHNFPFDHWEYSDALSEDAIDEIVKADIPDVSKHNLNYDGTRAIDGGAAEFRKGIACILYTSTRPRDATLYIIAAYG